MKASHSMPSGCVSQKDLQRLHDSGLSKDERETLTARINGCINCKRLWMIFSPAGSKPEAAPSTPDFIEWIEREIEEKILRVAKRLLEINWVNPKVSRRVIDEIFGDCPRPNDMSKRILEKCKELHSKKVA